MRTPLFFSATTRPQHLRRIYTGFPCKIRAPAGALTSSTFCDGPRFTRGSHVKCANRCFSAPPRVLSTCAGFTWDSRVKSVHPLARCLLGTLGRSPIYTGFPCKMRTPLFFSAATRPQHLRLIYTGFPCKIRAPAGALTLLTLWEGPRFTRDSRVKCAHRCFSAPPRVPSTCAGFTRDSRVKSVHPLAL